MQGAGGCTAILALPVVGLQQVAVAELWKQGRSEKDPGPVLQRASRFDRMCGELELKQP